VFVKTELGTCGIISPTLANFTLNVLEKAINDSLTPLTRSKEKQIVIKLKDGSKTRIASGLTYIRYADNNFLQERGLTLSSEKTKIFSISDSNAELNFLGYTFKYQMKWRINKRMFCENHSGSRGIALYPNKNKVLSFIKKIKSIFQSSHNSSAYSLIAKLNPVIRG